MEWEYKGKSRLWHISLPQPACRNQQPDCSKEQKQAGRSHKGYKDRPLLGKSRHLHLPVRLYISRASEVLVGPSIKITKNDSNLFKDRFLPRVLVTSESQSQ